MPEATVIINGTDYTQDTLSAVNITFGRTDITQNIRAAFASFSILSTGSGIPLDINQSVVITLETNIQPEVIFTGTISDFSIQLINVDTLQYQVTAVSPLAKLAQTTVGDSGFPAETQGARIERIIRDGSGTLTWAQTVQTWASATYPWNEGTLPTGVIDAGFDFGAMPAGAVESLSTLYKAALFGFLYEDPDGTLNFEDYLSRTGASVTTSIAADETIAPTLRSDLTSGQLINDVTISDFNNVNYSDVNSDSIIDYGRKATSFSTFMNSAFWINAVIDNYLADWSIPRQFISGFTFPLSAFNDTTRNKLITIRSNKKWEITGLPTAFTPFTGTTYTGWVEGWNWRIVKGQAFLSVYLSDTRLSEVFIPSP